MFAVSQLKFVIVTVLMYIVLKRIKIYSEEGKAADSVNYLNGSIHRHREHSNLNWGGGLLKLSGYICMLENSFME